MATESAVREQVTKAASEQHAHDEDHAYFFTAILNAAFRAEELGITPDQFLEICKAAVAPHHRLVGFEEVTMEPSQRIKEMGLTPEEFLHMCETIVSVMQQLLTDNLG